MNAFGYVYRRVLWQFGIKRVKKRWEVANKELQVLKEAEDLLGRVAWREADDVDELTGEFWQLRNIEGQEQELENEIERLTDENEGLEDEIFDLTEDLHEEIDQLVEQRNEVAEDVDQYLLEIEEIREEAAEIRRRFDGHKVKYKVLKEQNGSEEDLENIQGVLKELREQFNERKDLTISRNEQIESVETRLLQVDEAIHAKRTEIGQKTAKISQKIGENSKRLADCMAKLGAYERERSDLQSKIGLYLSANPTGTPGLRKATQKHMDLVGRINYFRKSIQYNQRLAKGA
jgi:chromosome segregation ATPase